MIPDLQSPVAGNRLSLLRYYRRHARIYDATRWTLLFGRSSLMDELAQGPPPSRVLEVGCGTGCNLVRLARHFPNASFTGLDLSEAMLARAMRKTREAVGHFRWVQAAYDRPVSSSEPFDLILFSYSLSMMNPGWETALAAAATDLAPNGRLAVVDFHRTPLEWYRTWMEQHQVRMDGQLLPSLCKRFRPRLARQGFAYGGAWEYFLFLGTRRAPAHPQRRRPEVQFLRAVVGSVAHGPPLARVFYAAPFSNRLGRRSAGRLGRAHFLSGG